MTSSFAENQSNDGAMPSMDFLEFIGEWETEQGEWLDPIALENEEIAKLIKTTSDTEADNEN
jgi:hypothetical protein